MPRSVALHLRHSALLAFVFALASPVGSKINFDSAALNTSINGPTELSYDMSGHLYIVESVGQRVLRLDIRSGSIKVVVHEPSKKNQDAFEIPTAVATDSQGDVYIADFNGRLRRKSMHAAGFDVVLPSPPKVSTGTIDLASQLVFDTDGNLLVADDQRHRILRLKSNGSDPEMVAGTGMRGFGGDGELANDARLAFPQGVAVNSSGDIFIADYGNCRIRKVDKGSHVITTIAGTGECKSSGDGSLAIHAQVEPSGPMAADSNGNLFFVEGGSNRVREIDTTGVIQTCAGTGEAGFSGDGGSADKAKLNNPSGIAVDSDGNIYIAEYVNNRIRRVDALTSKISTVAGNGKPARLDILL